MDDRIQRLPLPAAIDAAYLLLIGQLCVTLSRLFFGALYVAQAPVAVTVSWVAILVWVVALSVLVILFINILSCWKSTRNTFAELGHYPNSLLASDVLIIVAFFFVNSIAGAPSLFMGAVALDAVSINAYIQKIEGLWEPAIPLLFFSSALLIAAYYRWNVVYLAELRASDADMATPQNIDETEKGIREFNFVYRMFAPLFLVFGVAEVFIDELAFTIGIALVWIAFWLYVNFSWVVRPPTDTY